MANKGSWYFDGYQAHYEVGKNGKKKRVLTYTGEKYGISGPVPVNRVRLLVDDVGPGIADIDLAMQEGYSTASEEVRMLGFGAGMGMPNMKRCADGFQIASQVGKGTSICMEFNL